MATEPLQAQAPQALTLTELNRRIASLLNVPATRDVWVVAELSDFSQKGGHCYMELVEKSVDGRTVLARLRGIIWASTAAWLCTNFAAVTGQRLASGLKVMVHGSINYHSAYGMSFVINDINPDFTIGSLQRLRQEILARLEREGIINLNRSLEFTTVPQRIAVISAREAAGYGDFMHQLYSNERGLRFTVGLFEAVMQGDHTTPTVIAALERIAAEEEQWDCVVIIRGGGATSDLTSFDSYDLAANVAQFPLPVIVGIGHERDVTVLDFVAALRVKTPTAAAEWLIARANAFLDRLRLVGQSIVQTTSDALAGALQQLAHAHAALPLAANGALERANTRLTNATLTLRGIGAQRLLPALEALRHRGESIEAAAQTALSRNSQKLQSLETLLGVLSPEATLRRGYSITRINGQVVTSAQEIKIGDIVDTTLADGTINSIVT